MTTQNFSPPLDNVGFVETNYFHFADPSHPFELELGGHLDHVDLAYETYGTLNSDKTNVILVAHAFTGDAHAAGYHQGEQTPGWWDFMIGPGKTFDTTKYFVLCINMIGGCRGSTGPSSINPATGKPYALDFPIITVKDIVRTQKILLEHLGVKRVLCVTGGSMGGMQALQWLASYPEAVKSIIPIATTLKHSPQQIAFNEVGRQAIMSDPAWRGGNYYGHGQPERGLALARMIGHITYMSDQSMEEKFSRRLREQKDKSKFRIEFEVENYLHYRGSRFVKRFDANSYLYLTKAMDYFDLSGEKLCPKGKKIHARVLVISFQSDWLYPSYQSKEIVKLLKAREAEAIYCEIPSTYGHDAFLIEKEEQNKLIVPFLEKSFKEERRAKDGNETQ